MDLESSMDIIYFHNTLEESKRLLTMYKEILIKTKVKRMYWIIELVVNYENSIDDKYSKELEKYINTP